MPAQSTPEGLTDDQVAERLKEYGPNKLPESNRSPILQFLGYLWNPLSWAMEAAAVIAIVLLDYADFALILFLLLLNAVISFREEASAVRTLPYPAPSPSVRARSLCSSPAYAIISTATRPWLCATLSLPESVYIFGSSCFHARESSPSAKWPWPRTPCPPQSSVFP